MATAKKSAAKKPAAKKSAPKKAAAKKPAAKKAAPKKAASAATPTATEGTALNKGAVSTTIALADVSVKKGFNPRTHLGDLKVLEASIKSQGLLSALVVRPAVAADKVKTPFILVAGERRFTSLNNIGWKKPVPVIVRDDLAGDDLVARAVAAAENSEDGRTNLNTIEYGRVAKELQDNGDTVAAIAKKMALPTHTVRRALQIMDADEDIQKGVIEGKIKPTNALELLKMPEETRKAVQAELGENTTVADIKAMRKKVEKEAAATEGTGTTPQKTTKSGKVSQRQPTAWKGSRPKQAQISRIAHFYANATDEERETTDFFELRGALAYALWDRGDLDDALLPGVGTTDKAEKKILAVFEEVVKAEAEKYVDPDAKGDDDEV